jgi:4-amino-4-deoxy-L-arabinose transferase-like glycosyltransferase
MNSSIEANTVQLHEQESSPALLKRISRVLMITSLLFLGFYFVVYLVYAANLIAFPFDYDQGEGFELVDTLMFARGEFPYQSVEPYPFYASNYPPVFHLIAVPFAWVFGATYWYGRLLGFLGTLITASAISYAVYSFDQRKGYGRGRALVAVVSGLAFLSSNFVYHIGPLLRQHMTMVMFETLAVVILCFANEIDDTSRRRRVFALGLALLIIAGYTKQLAAFSAVAVFLWLALRSPRRAVIAVIAFGLIGAGIFVSLNIATQGEWWRQAILANVNQIRFDQVEGLFRLWFSLHGFLLIPAVLFVIYELYFDRLSLYSIWFVVTALFGGVSSGTWGGGDSYFATSIAAMCILSGIFISRTLNSGWRFPVSNLYTRFFIQPLRPVWPLIISVALVVVPLVYLGYGRAVLHLPTNHPLFVPLATALDIQPNALNGFYDSAGRIAGGYADIGHLTTDEDIAAGWSIVERVRQSEKPVLSEEAAFNLLAGREAVSNPTQLLNVWLRGLYDGSELIDMIEAQEFGLVILRAQFYPEPVLIAIHTFYETDQIVNMNGFEYVLLTPINFPEETTNEG